jgi:hypothetical protein
MSTPAGPTRPSASDSHLDGCGAAQPVSLDALARGAGGWAPDHRPAVAPYAMAVQPVVAALYSADPRHEPLGALRVPPARGLEHPLLLGALLLVAPPLGLALLWASPAYGREAKIALTGFSAMMVILAAAFGLVLLAR